MKFFSGKSILASSLMALASATLLPTLHAQALDLSSPIVTTSIETGNGVDEPQIQKFVAESNNSRNKSLPAIRPTQQVLADVYIALVDKGYVDATAKPDEQLLLDVYVYATDSGLISAKGSPSAEELKALKPYHQGSFSGSSSELVGLPSGPDLKAASCKQSAAKCVAAGFLTVAGCVIAADSAGALAPACYLAITAAGIACSTDVSNNCPSNSSVTAADYSAGRRGTYVTGDIKTTHLCSGNQRVRDLDVYGKYVSQYASNVVTGIEITCSPNSSGNQTYYSFVNAPNDTYYGGSTCGNNPWNLAQGFTIRAGDVIDAMAIQCDRTFDTSVANWVGTVYGGTGGSQTNQLCTEGQYVSGLRTWHDSTKKIVKSVEVLCRSTVVN